jgi:hypothetical protein
VSEKDDRGRDVSEREKHERRVESERWRQLDKNLLSPSPAEHIQRKRERESMDIGHTKL